MTVAQWLYLAGVSALLTTFTASLAGKATRQGRATFRSDLRVPHALERWQPLVTPSVLTGEVAVVALLAAGLWTSVFGVLGAAMGAAMLLSFTWWLRWTLARGDRRPCRCFGGSSSTVGPMHVVRNAGLLLVALVVLGTGVAAADLAVTVRTLPAVLLGGLVAIVLIHLDDVAFLFGGPLISDEVRALIVDPDPGG